jgi:hypothetical protein
MDPVYLTELMGCIGECVLSVECVVSSIPIIKYVFGLSGYVALWVDFGVIWWLRVLAEVRVRD